MAIFLYILREKGAGQASRTFALAAVGRPPFRPPSRVPPSAGTATFPQYADAKLPLSRSTGRMDDTAPTWSLTQTPPRELGPPWGRLPPAHPLELQPPWDDDPSAHPLEIDRPRSSQLPPGRADAYAPARAPAAVGRRPHPPSR